MLWVADRLRSGAAGVGGTFTLRDHVHLLSQISIPSPSPQQTSANQRPSTRQKAMQKILNRDFKALRIFVNEGVYWPQISGIFTGKGRCWSRYSRSCRTLVFLALCGSPWTKACVWAIPRWSRSQPRSKLFWQVRKYYQVTWVFSHLRETFYGLDHHR